MNRLTRQQVIEFHRRLIDQYGGLHGIRNESLLDAALEAPFAAFGGQPLFPTVRERCGRLAFGIVANHPFNDGNKRIGVFAAFATLRLNGYSITSTPAEATGFGMGLASGSINYQDALNWIQHHSIAPKIEHSYIG